MATPSARRVGSPRRRTRRSVGRRCRPALASGLRGAGTRWLRGDDGGYHAWLVAELEAIDGPIDLVGHDWGTGHVAGIAADRPDLIRSFAMDCGGLVHPDYVWHDMAQAWQTPEVGSRSSQR